MAASSPDQVQGRLFETHHTVGKCRLCDAPQDQAAKAIVAARMHPFEPPVNGIAFAEDMRRSLAPPGQAMKFPRRSSGVESIIDCPLPQKVKALKE